MNAPTRITRLRLPPRKLPFALACQAFLNLPGFLLALLFASAMLWATFGSGDAHVQEVPGLRVWGQKAPAAVAMVEAENLTVDGEPLAKVTYEFNAEGHGFRQTTYDFASHWQPGQTATALYLPGDPAVSRLQGEKRPHAGVFGSSLYFIPLAAVFLGIPFWRRGFRDLLLLREGLTADAQLLDCRALPGRERGVEVCRCNYEFESLWGEVFRGSAVVPVTVAPTPREIEDASARRSVIYLPRDAAVSTLVDALPMRYGLKVDRRGEWVAGIETLPVLSAWAAAGTSALALLGLILQVLGLLGDLGR